MGGLPPIGFKRSVSVANSFWGVRGVFLPPVLLRRSRVIHRRFFARAGYQQVILRLSPEKTAVTY